VPYFHGVFALPARIADIAYQNKTVIYGILFKTAAEPENPLSNSLLAAEPEMAAAGIVLLHFSPFLNFGNSL
jgi:hypothetical protein